MDIRITITESGKPEAAPGFLGALGATNTPDEKRWDVELASVEGTESFTLSAIEAAADAARHIYVGPLLEALVEDVDGNPITELRAEGDVDSATDGQF